MLREQCNQNEGGTAANTRQVPQWRDGHIVMPANIGIRGGTARDVTIPGEQAAK
jgi:hypothetical protein